MSAYFTKGDRSSGPLFTKGVRTPAAHLFSKHVPMQHQTSHASAAAVHAEERAMAFLQRPKSHANNI